MFNRSRNATVINMSNLLDNKGRKKYRSHPVRKNGPIRKLYCNAIGTTEIVGKKKFKIWCHIVGYNDSQASTGRGVGEAFAVLT